MRVKKYFVIGLVIIIILPSVSDAQFIDGTSILGAHIGVSNVAKATVLGVKFETVITNAGSGVIGFGAIADYYSYNAGDFGTQTYIFINASALYHLKLDDGSFDPFFGIGAGYLIEKNTYPPTGGIAYYNTDGSGFKAVISIGARYFLSPTVALRLEFGSSLVYAVGGIDFGF